MKIIVLGDTHGRSFWKYIVNTQQFDKLVFIGDYWDSFDISFDEQQKNFLDIVAYKKANPDKVILILGNHDVHYFPQWTGIGEHYSGFQGTYYTQIQFLLQEHKDLFQMAWKWKDYLFTHAGVTSTWVKSTMNLLDEHEVSLVGLSIDDYINDVWAFSPKHFYFNGRNPYGDNVTQSPIWVRPESLTKNAYQFETLKQVVGHTQQNSITVQKGRYFFIDTLGFSRQYLILEGDEYIIDKI